MPQLVVEFPDGRRQRFTLGQNEVILGRDQACDICLPDPKISRRHAKIRRQGADWVIEDMGSINGYLVDGTASHGRSKLHPGSRIVLGEFALVIEADGAAAQARADMPAFSLYVTEGPLAGQRLALQNGELSVGRSSEADVALDDPSMSRRHASLRVSADGVEVRDLGSSNGTFVDGEQVRQQRVKTGQIIRFGNVKMRLEGQPAGQNSPQRHEVSVATRDVAHKVRASLPDLKAAEAAGSPHAAAGRPAAAPAAAAGDAAGAAAGRPAAAMRKSGRLAAHQAWRWASTAGDQLRRRLGKVACIALLLALTGITWQQRARLRRLSGAHSPGSSQTLAALLGRGPSADERAWRARINAKLQAAVAKLEDASFSDAAALFGEVLDEEPIEPRALQGRREALVRLGQNEGLSGGKHALQAAHPFEALVAASSALVRGSLPVRAADGAPSDTDPDGDAPRDDGDGNGDPDGGKKVVEQPSRVPAPGAGNVAVVAPAPLLLHDLQTLAEQGAGKVAQICGERAQAACLGEDFVNCLQQTACLQAFDPNDELAAALLALAAEVVANPASPRSPQPLQAIYPEPRMRRAMLTYATGGYAVANKQLHVLVGAKSLALQADITQLGELTDQASKAAAAGDLQTALGLYQEAASIDKRLVPQGVASAPRQSLTRAAQAIFLRIGQTQQEQGKFAEAVSTWQRGLSLHAASLPLQRALLQLHLRAEKLMAQAKAAEAAGPSKGDKGRDLCQPLKEALEMTGEDDPLHESIKTKLAACSRKKSKSGKKPSKSAD